jgi:hypothetical protein
LIVPIEKGWAESRRPRVVFVASESRCKGKRLRYTGRGNAGAGALTAVFVEMASPLADKTRSGAGCDRACHSFLGQSANELLVRVSELCEAL